nr:hypothetical protein [Tanacetum cinerariifolium]
MVKALLLDKKSQSPAPVKAVEENCVTCGGAHSYRNCPATNGNVYRENIQEFVSQASAVNYNQGNTSYRPPMMNNQNRFIPNKNRGNNFNQGPVYQPSVFQPPAYQAPAHQTQGVSKEDFSAYVKANDAVMRNMQTQGQNMQNQLTNLTDLITKFVNSNSASTSSSGTLPSNTIANPRSDLKAITTRSEATKDTVNPTNNESTKDVQPQVVQSELTYEPVTSPISEPAIAPIFKDMSFEISFADALILMPKFASTLKALIGNKEKLSEMARTPLNEHCSAVLLKKLPEKLGDPGKFLIPYDFPAEDVVVVLIDEIQLDDKLHMIEKPVELWTERSILLTEKLTGSNFTNWYRNLRIVLRYEKKLKFAKQPLEPALDPETADPYTIDKYYESFNLEQLVACFVLSRRWLVSKLLSLEDEELLGHSGKPRLCNAK